MFNMLPYLWLAPHNIAPEITLPGERDVRDKLSGEVHAPYVRKSQFRLRYCLWTAPPSLAYHYERPDLRRGVAGEIPNTVCTNSAHMVEGRPWPLTEVFLCESRAPLMRGRRS